MADGYEYVRMYTAQTDTNMPTRKEGRFDKRRVFFRRDGFCYAIATNLVFWFMVSQAHSFFPISVFLFSKTWPTIYSLAKRRKARRRTRTKKKIGLADLGQHASFFSLSHNWTHTTPSLLCYAEPTQPTHTQNVKIWSGPPPAHYTA